MRKLKSLSISKSIAIVMFIVLFIIPQVSSLYSTQMFGKIITFMIFALALDILWGSTGLMNLGFAVFFGIGGYLFGISMASQTELPGFMASAGLEELPWFYRPLQSPVVAVILGIVIPALVALLLGYFIFTSNIKGVFYNLITLTFAGIFELFIKNQQAYTGGSSGVNGIGRGLNTLSFFGNSMTIVHWYYVAFVCLILAYIFCVWLTESRFGKIINSIRDNEERVQFLGYNPASFKLVIFAIAGAIAGFAGVLYIPITSFISIETAGLTFSSMALVWISVGGRGNLTGAMFGALTISILQNFLSGMFSGMWQLVLGVILLIVVMFIPRGLIGTLIHWSQERKNKAALQGQTTK